MTKAEVKLISENITNEELFNMLDNARKNISNWNVRSLVNKGMSKGVAWNVLGMKFNINQHYHIMAKRNMIREFGDYLPENLKIKKDKKKPSSDFFHNEPDFSEWK